LYSRKKSLHSKSHSMRNTNFYILTISPMQPVQVTYHFDGILEPLQESIQKYVSTNLYVNPDQESPLLKPYFKKVFANKPDAQIIMHIHITKNKAERFEGIFSCIVDWEAIRYERTGTESFKNPQDLVNHAFSHVKREITGDRGILRKLAKRFQK
jgi:hypothetical protein